jgi:hypothetical protein
MAKYFALFLSVLFFIGCSSDEDNQRFLPMASGEGGDLIVWVKQDMWKGKLGDTIREKLRKTQYGLPQSEPIFNVQHTTDKSFSKVYKSFGNILIFEIDPSRVTGPKMDIQKNVWARHQLIVRIKAKNEEGLIKKFNEESQNLIDYFEAKSLDRLYHKNKSAGSEELNKRIDSLLNIEITTMKGMYFARSNKDFVWLRLERERERGGFKHQISQGVLVFKYPYTSSDQLQPTNIIKKADSALKATIPGPVENSYMDIDMRFVSPRAEEINFRDHFATEIRGLWRTEGYLMGGPFVMLTILNEKKDEIVTAYGYAYAPEFDKREYLREVEAVIKSIRFKEKKKKKEES